MSLMQQQAIFDAMPYAAAIVAAKKRQTAALPSWRDKAHPGQVPPEGPWRTWYIRGGRGGGKTWTGSHVLAEWALERPGVYAVVAPTYAAGRDVCVEGESGLLAALGSSVKSWNRSMHDLRLVNGSSIFVDGADDGAPTIQGMNLSGLWADEVGLWRRWKPAWEEAIRYAVRMPGARIIATGTPKRGHGLVKSLMDDETVPKTVLPTLANAANLDEALIADLIRKYGGTTLGRQELGGELMGDAEGAMWHRDLIKNPGSRMPMTIDTATGKSVPNMARIVVAIDPAVTHDVDSDETGIVVAGIGRDGKGYVLADDSLKASPAGWATVAVKAYHLHKADRIIAESNNGGEMVELTIHSIDPNVPVKLVHASQGKRTRAEPVLSKYEQGEVFHADPLPELEDQMCNWDPILDAQSPDRVDALVWALTDLMLGSAWGSGPASAIA